MTIGKLIDDELKKKGMKQKDLAAKIPISPQSVSAWISGTKEPNVGNIRAMDAIFGDGFGNKCFSHSLNKGKIIAMQTKELKDLDTFEKAHHEAEIILNSCNASVYPYSACTLANWAITCVIGLVYHQFVNDKKIEDEESLEIEDIYYYLNDIIENEGSDIGKDFFLLGGDLFESWGDHKLSNHDYALKVFNLWNKLKTSLDAAKGTQLYSEFLIVIVKVLMDKSSY